MIRERDELVSALKNFQKRVWITGSDLSPVSEEEKVSMKQMNLQVETIREVQAKKQSFKILLEELAAQPVEKKRKVDSPYSHA